jgi:hypothetical protein
MDNINLCIITYLMTFLCGKLYWRISVFFSSSYTSDVHTGYGRFYGDSPLPGGAANLDSGDHQYDWSNRCRLRHRYTARAQYHHLHVRAIFSVCHVLPIPVVQFVSAPSVVRCRIRVLYG